MLRYVCSMDLLLQVPKRRAVSEMKRELGGLTAGDAVRVLFSNDRQGAFLVSGPAHANSLGELVVGATFLAGPAVPVSDNTGDWTSRKPEDDVKKILAEERELVPGKPSKPDDIRHGDLVEAEFEQNPYGAFRIFGVATDSVPAGTTMVGGWVITGHGVVNFRLLGIRLIATAGEHDVPVPANRPPLATNVI